MSLKQLEEAIKNRHNTNIVEWRAKHPKEPMTMFEQCACDLENQFRKVEVEFDAFKKQVEELCKKYGEEPHVKRTSAYKAINQLLEETK